MMTREEFILETERVCNLYNKPLNETQLDFWFEELKKYDLLSYKRAVSEYAIHNKYMPTISDILEYIKALKPREQPKEQQKYECKACKGTGYALYHKIINGTSYEYASLCNCQNAVGKEYDGTKCKEPSKYYIPKAVDVFNIGGAK